MTTKLPVHHCHATACTVRVLPELFMCRPHWYLVPPQLRRRIWSTYRAGQCDDKRPSPAYCQMARAAVIAVAEQEDREPDTRGYDAYLARSARQAVTR